MKISTGRALAGLTAGVSLAAVGAASLTPAVSAQESGSDNNSMNSMVMMQNNTMPTMPSMGQQSTQNDWWQKWMNDWNNSQHNGQNNGSSWSQDQVYGTFLNGFNQVNNTFRGHVRDSLNQAYYRIGSGNSSGLYTFYNRFQSDNARFDQMVNQAASEWHANWNGANRDQARNTFIDKFNNAKAWYYNDLNQAKDQLSSDLNRANQAPAKDSFMNSFNSWMAMSGNQLEALKNALAQRTM